MPSLTAIRGIAALIVVLFHVHETFPDEQLFFVSLFRNGGFGVDLFFVLSGFIMAHVYTNAPRRRGSAFFGLRFIKARLARIYPLHLATLLATAGLVLAMPGFANRYPDYFDTGSFVLNLLLMQNWGWIGPSWNMVSWSISAEWFMYLAFPAMLVAYTAARSRLHLHPSALAFGLLAGVGAAYAAVIHLKGWDHYGGMSAGGMVRVFFEFTLGFLVYQVRGQLHPVPGTWKFEVFGLAVVALVALALLARAFWPLLLPAVALLIATLSTNRGWAARVLEGRVLVYLGEISFSLYMWHWLVIQVHNVLRDAGVFLPIHTRGDLYLQALSMVTLSLAAAALSYAWIEKPARAWINPIGTPRAEAAIGGPADRPH